MRSVEGHKLFPSRSESFLFGLWASERATVHLGFHCPVSLLEAREQETAACAHGRGSTASADLEQFNNFGSQRWIPGRQVSKTMQGCRPHNRRLVLKPRLKHVCC